MESFDQQTIFAATTNALEAERHPDITDGHDPTPRPYEVPKSVLSRRVQVTMGHVALNGGFENQPIDNSW